MKYKIFQNLTGFFIINNFYFDNVFNKDYEKYLI